MTIKRRGVEQKFVSGDFMDAPDPIFCHALAKAHEWHHKVRQGETLHHIATFEEVSQSLIRARIRLAYFAPKIQAAILDRTQPPDLTLEKIVRSKMPSCWQKQKVMYGFK